MSPSDAAARRRRNTSHCAARIPRVPCARGAASGLCKVRAASTARALAHRSLQVPVAAVVKSSDPRAGPSPLCMCECVSVCVSVSVFECVRVCVCVSE